VDASAFSAMIGAASSGTKWRRRSEGASRGRPCIAAAVVLWGLTFDMRGGGDSTWTSLSMEGLGVCCTTDCLILLLCVFCEYARQKVIDVFVHPAVAASKLKLFFAD
jgi:hypothetical protein